ncbi:MAG TPA: hypothetical protein VND40_04810 [Nitrososphaerales archaeon]|nr:hypothetical protein [Nitrososphaerales archaeon]
MIGDKTVNYVGKNTDLNALNDSIVKYLQTDGFKVQAPKLSTGGYLIQAQKGGFLSEVISAERALNITIQGQPNNFSLRIGVGKWVQNAGVTVAEAALLSPLFLPIDVAEMSWTVHVENGVFKKIDDIVKSAPVSAPVAAAVPAR